MVGEGNTQIIASYNTYHNVYQGTWTDRVAPPPLGEDTGAMRKSPYRGLAAFGEQDAGFFFGREDAAGQVLNRISQRLSHPGLLMVSGVSGAGKSSLLQAGVLQGLRDSGLDGAPGARSWPCLVLTPGRVPLAGLASVATLAGIDAGTTHQALRADPADFALTARQVAEYQPAGTSAPDQTAAWRGRRLLLIVDQFEQLFTQCHDEDQRAAFLTALHAAATAGHGADDRPAALVVLVVRADFEARCAEYPLLAEAVQDRYLVTAMTERQLRMVITEPAKKTGSRVDEDLVTVLLDDIRRAPGMAAPEPGPGMPGVLPLLSHVLDTAWRSRTGGSLTVLDYERAGGIERAIADSAERAYAPLTSAQQAAAQTVFLRLTATSPDGTITAGRATRAELLDGKNAARTRDIDAVLEAFARERLLTLAAGTVEISHEMLLRAWPLLRDQWLAGTQADRIVRTRLRAAASEWDRSGRDRSYLYTGSLLQDATTTAARADRTRQPELSPAENEFLHASNRARRRAAGARRGALAVLVSLTIGLAAATITAYHSGQTVARQRDDAIASQLITQSEAQEETSPTAAKIKSLAAWQLDPTPQSRYALISAATSPGLAVLGGHTVVNAVAFSPDGRTLAAASDGGTVRLWDVAARRQIGQLTDAGPVGLPDAGSVDAVAFSPDGRTLAAADDGTVRLWDVAARRQIGQPFTASSVSSVAFSPDGRTLAVSAGGEVLLRDVATGRLTGPPLTAGTGFGPLAFSSRGQTLLTGNGDSARLWNVATGRQIGQPFTAGPATNVVRSVALSPDGQVLAAGNIGTLRLWNVATRRQIGQPFTAPASNSTNSLINAVNSVAFSRDGRTLAAGIDDGTARLWDAATLQPIGPPLTVSDTTAVNSVAFSPDGRTLATGNADGTVRLWDIAQQIGQPFSTGTINDGVDSMAFSPDGRALATDDGDGTARLWNMATRRPVSQPLTTTSGEGGAVFDVTFSPDGRALAIGTGDNMVQLWDLAAHRQIGPPLTAINLHTVVKAALSPDGQILATENTGGTVQLWDLKTQHQIGKTITQADGVDLMTFSPDGQILATTGGSDDTVRLWDAATQHQIGKTITAASPSSSALSTIEAMAFSPGGRTLATSIETQGTNIDNNTVLWHVATQRQIGEITDTGAAVAVAFSPDGQTLATGSPDGTVRLWDAATKQQIGPALTDTAITDTGALETVAFSPDGQTLAVGGSSDGSSDGIQLWNLNAINHPLAQVCGQIGGSVTPAEWTQYVPAGPAYSRVCP